MVKFCVPTCPIFTSPVTYLDRTVTCLDNHFKTCIKAFSIDINCVSQFPILHIVLTKEELILLRELSDRTGYARVKAEHSVKCLNKITAKKKHPDVITFIFEDNDLSQILT